MHQYGHGVGRRTDLFLGGWHGPFLPVSLGWIWFLIKVGAILFFYVWMRWTPALPLRPPGVRLEKVLLRSR
jgi:NADH:ubiquinone oxidoreductase subunit H